MTNEQIKEFLVEGDAKLKIEHSIYGTYYVVLDKEKIDKKYSGEEVLTILSGIIKNEIQETMEVSGLISYQVSIAFVLPENDKRTDTQIEEEDLSVPMGAKLGYIFEFVKEGIIVNVGLN
jgi:hypothetical protein